MYAYKKIKNITFILILVLLTGTVFAQETTEQLVTGTITDASTGLPLGGISVAVPNYSSTATNDSGTFTIKVPDYETILEISGKDIQFKEVALKGKHSISIKLYEEAFNSIHDLAMLPYSQKTKSEVTNSVVTLNGTWTNPGSLENTLQGRIAGMNVITRSGTPGIGANIFLRGYSSFYGNNQPLIVVDGVPYDYQNYSSSQIDGYVSDPLSHIDVKDIDNITVIKDAVSLYGAKAANGVILINTVHARENATKIDFYVNGGMNFTPKQLPVMDASDFRTYLTEQFKNNNLSDDWIASQPYMNNDVNSTDYKRYHNNTNWQDKVFDRSTNQDYYLRVTGGDEIAKYGLSVGYMKNTGILRNTDFSKYNVRFNSDIIATSKLTINANLGFTYGEHNLMNDGIAPKTNPIYLSLIKSSFFTPNVLDNNGEVTKNVEDVDSLGIGNPAAVINSLEARSKAYRFTGSVKLNYKINTHINLNSILGLTFDKNDENVFIPDRGFVADTLLTTIAYDRAISNVARLSSVFSDSWLNYNKIISNVHFLSVNLGFRYSTNSSRDDIARGYNTPIDALKFLDSGTSNLDRTGGSAEKWKWMTYYAGVDYSLKKKYFASLNLSMDGSSRFGSDANGINLFSHKFGFFPSIGAAWLVSSENFMSDMTLIEQLKLRASYGITGNDDVGKLNSSKYYTPQGFIGYSGLVSGEVPNTHTQWETNKKMNLGADMAFLNERLQINVDFFHNITDNMLTFNPIDKISGSNVALINNGTVQNNGFELNINGRIRNGIFKWDAGIGIAHYKNKIKKLPGGEFTTNIAGGTILSRVGEPVGVFYGYHSLGVFASDADAAQSGQTNRMPNDQLVNAKGGDIWFLDSDQNGIIDQNDREIIGNPNPKFTGMFTNHFVWKRISLDILFTFSYGNKVYNQLRSSLESLSGYENQSTTALNRWKYDGQITDIPKSSWGDPMGNARFSNRWIEDGSYIKLRTISISYDLPFKTGFFKNATVYMAANNLITLTHYLGYDPEFSMSSSCFAQGIDAGLTPQFRSMYIGFRIGL